MDRKAVAFARSWATRYVRTKHPHGLDVEDVENRILESLYKYSRGKMNGRDSARPSQDGEATASQCMMKALSEALNEIQNESRRNLRALCPWQVRNAGFRGDRGAYFRVWRAAKFGGDFDPVSAAVDEAVRSPRRDAQNRGGVNMNSEGRQMAFATASAKASHRQAAIYGALSSGRRSLGG